MASIIAVNGLEATYSYIDNMIVCRQSKEDGDRSLQRHKEVAAQYNISYNMSKCLIAQHEITYLGYSISNVSLRPDPDRIKSLMDLPIPNDSSIWIKNYFKRIQPILHSALFPLYPETVQCLEALKEEISKASVTAFDELLPLDID